MKLASFFEPDIKAARAEHDAAGDTLIYIEKPFEEKLNILSWLRAFPTASSFYFKDKQGEYELAGLEAARTFQGTSLAGLMRALNPLWEINPAIRVGGGCRFFETEAQSPEWEGFEQFHFVLPRVMLYRNAHQTRLAVCHYAAGQQTPARARQQLRGALQQLDELHRDPQPSESQPLITGRQRIPEQPQWVAGIQQALQAIADQQLSKIVLARKEVWRAAANWNVSRVLARLSEIEEESFLFAVQIAPHKAFLGRSPERLFRIRDHIITTEALAGTRPRGTYSITDQLMTSELLGNAKELEEHRIVARYIQQQVDPWCCQLQTEIKEQAFKLKNLQHILTRFCGELKNGCQPLEVLHALHPTPAVGGHPTSKALALIQQMEPFQRGWYAAPVGWMSRSAADFAVGIRSALIHGPELHLYAGTGIVDGSEPLSEWHETSSKLRNFSVVTGAEI